MTFMEFSRNFTTQGFSKNLETLEQKGKLNVTVSANISSALFRARLTNSIVYGTHTESFYKTMLLQCLLYLDQERWFLVKSRTNLSLRSEELMTALENLDLQMRNKVTNEVAHNLAVLYIVIDVLYCFYSKKRIEMRSIMNQQIDGPGITMRTTIERSQDILKELQHSAGENKANRDASVCGFLNATLTANSSPKRTAF